MSTTKSASLVIMGAFDGTAPTPAENLFFSQMPLGGYIFFKRNIPENFEHALPDFFSSIQNKYAQAALFGPLLLGVDQEGGRVSRLGSPCPNLGAALNIFTDDCSPKTLESILNYGFSLGTFLKSLGFNINFAPVVDIFTNPENTCIGDRAFGKTPEAVTLRAGSFLEGLQSAGILGCLKHFPGQGEATIDTHQGSAHILASLKELKTRELIPYKRLLAHSQSVMIAHCIYPALDSTEATRSRVIVKDLLIKDLGYKGLIISDDMIMGAMPQNDEQTWGEALCQAIDAGIDLLIISKNLDRIKFAIKFLTREAAKSAAFAQRLTEAAEKVVRIRKSMMLR